MVISKLNIDKVLKHLGLIQELLEELESIKTLSKEDFFSDKKNAAAVESYLRRALESAFDAGRHILAKSYGAKDLEYRKIAEKLGDKGVLSKEYSETLKKMAGYRNRMVHLYNEIDNDELFNILHSHLNDLEKFINEVTDFLERYKKAVKNNID